MNLGDLFCRCEKRLSKKPVNNYVDKYMDKVDHRQYADCVLAHNDQLDQDVFVPEEESEVTS